MAIARRKLVCLQQTPFYHCTSRCVRQSFLCGNDTKTGENYEHRRAWLEDLILHAAAHFCIDVAGYACMSNHYHIVVRIDDEAALALSDDEAITRWTKLYSESNAVSRYKKGEILSQFELLALNSEITRWRIELANLSRFMAYINERFARRANAEDGCKGRFWEGRFESQALLDDTSVLRMLCYVDLNPVRAGISDHPEESDHTSIKRRVRHGHHGLLPFKPSDLHFEQHTQAYLPITFKNYLDLIDSCGRVIRSDKRGAIPQSSPPIFQRLALPTTQWIKSMMLKPRWQQKAVGTKLQIAEYCAAVDRKWIWQNPLLSSG